jgi:hypothetical protein
MVKEKSKPQEESKLSWKVTPKVLPKGARKLKRTAEFDAIIEAVKDSEETSFQIAVEGRDYRKLWSPLTSRIKEFNSNPQREYNLELHTANKETYITKVDKK